MVLVTTRSNLRCPPLIRTAARRAYRSHGVNLAYPPSACLAPSTKGEPKAKPPANGPAVSVEPIKGATRTSNSRSIQNAIRPSIRDPLAENSMRMTHALSPDILTNLSPTFQKFALKDKIAVVTGGARGLGLNMAQALCESGIKAVALFDIQPALGESMAETLSTATGIPVKYYHVDIVDEDKVDAAISQVVEDFGAIDILVNSAGVAFSNIPAETYKVDHFEKTININLIGSFRIARAVGRHMIAAACAPGNNAANATSPTPLPDRSIILIASMSGTIVNYPQPQCAYNASKAGVIQLGKSLASEWSKHGIRVNTISPGYMDTALNRLPVLERQKKVWKERTPMGRLGAVEELNNLVIWLAGEGSSFCTGADLRIDGGYSVW